MLCFLLMLVFCPFFLNEVLHPGLKELKILVQDFYILSWVFVHLVRLFRNGYHMTYHQLLIGNTSNWMIVTPKISCIIIIPLRRIFGACLVHNTNVQQIFFRAKISFDLLPFVLSSEKKTWKITSWGISRTFHL